MRVFIADDEPLILLGFQKMVTACGHEVTGTAGTGPEALDAILRLAPDVIMMDINLPGMDGISVIERIQETLHIPAIVITGYHDPAITGRVSAAGVFGYLQKPVDQCEIESALSIAVARYREQRDAEQERDRALTQLSERKLIERAKGLLMEQFEISEERAMRFLQRKSRNENRKLSLVAQEILAKSDLLK